MFEGVVNRVWFSGSFDSGNLHEVSEGKIVYNEKNGKFENVEYDFLRKSDRQFLLKTRPDALGQPKQSNNRSWFHFAIKNTSSTELQVTINITDLNKHNKLYQQGLRPVIRTSGNSFSPQAELCSENFIEKGWKRLRWHAIAYGNVEDYGFCVSFPLKLPPGQYFYLAFCYPFSYHSSLKLLDLVKSKVHDYNNQLPNTKKIHYEQQLLCNSYEQREVRLLTITERLPILTASQSVLPDSTPNTPREGASLGYQDELGIIPGMFEENFADRKAIVITARVHPGETPGQLTFSGFLRFILSDDPRAVILRSKFVIRCVPILNPDGVYRGHYRTDYFGYNLNRFYLEPDTKLHPQCYALKTLMTWICDARPNAVEDVFFLDMHAHAAKRGCFLFGNALPDHTAQVDNVLYAKLTEQNSAYFDFEASNFTQKNMHVVDRRDGMARDGCTRVAFYKLFNLKYCYTLESNYNSGRWPPRKLQPHTPKFYKEHGGRNWLSLLQDDKMNGGSPSGVYTDELCWLEVGAALIVTILDLFRICPNQLSRVQNYSRTYQATEKSLPSYVRQLSSSSVSKIKSDTNLKPTKKPTSTRKVGSGTKISSSAKKSSTLPPTRYSPKRYTSQRSVEQFKKPMKMVTSEIGDARAMASVVQGYFEPTLTKRSSPVVPQIGDHRRSSGGGQDPVTKKFEQLAVTTPPTLKFKRLPQTANSQKIPQLRKEVVGYSTIGATRKSNKPAPSHQWK